MTALLALLVLASPQTEWRNGIVVATTGTHSAQAGLTILKQGGSAADAAVATALTQVVDSGGCYVSAAGIFTMVYYDASTGKTFYLDACYDTPREEKDAMSIPMEKSGRTTLVPGFMAGIDAAQARFGKLTRPQVFQPAIDLAENGFKLDAFIGGLIQHRKNLLSLRPETKRVFAKPDGTFYNTGDLFRQPEIAETYRQVAKQGAVYMYTGEWGKRMVAAVRAAGGKLSAQDMAAYKPIWQEPIRSKFRGYEIAAPGFASSGGVSIIEALNLVELANLRKSGHFTQSEASLHNLMQISHTWLLSYLPERTLKDYPGRNLLPASRVEKETSAWIWGQMKEGKMPWTVKVVPGTHSDGIVAVDKWGNVAAVTHSINTTSWGETGIFVDGVSIPDSAAHQKYLVNMTGPGKRLPAPTNPLLVMKDGKPWLGSSAIGGGLHSRTLQILTSILEFDWDLEKAVAAPAFLLPSLSGNTNTAGVEANQFDSGLLDKVRALGQKVDVVTGNDVFGRRGYWVGVRIDPKAGLSGAGTSILPVQRVGY